MKGDNTSKLIELLDGCSEANREVVYFPVESIGEMVATALAMRREVRVLEDRAERLQEQLDQLRAR